MEHEKIIIDGVEYVRITLILQTILSPKLSTFIDDLELDKAQLQMQVHLLNEKINLLQTKTPAQQLTIDNWNDYCTNLMHDRTLAEKQLKEQVIKQNLERVQYHQELKSWEHKWLQKNKELNQLKQELLAENSPANDAKTMNCHAQKTTLQQREELTEQNKALKWMLRKFAISRAEKKYAKEIFFKAQDELAQQIIDELSLEEKILYLTIEHNEQATQLEQLTASHETLQQQLQGYEALQLKHELQQRELANLKNALQALGKNP